MSAGEHSSPLRVLLEVHMEFGRLRTVREAGPYNGVWKLGRL